MNDLISRLSEIRSNYNCLDEAEEPYYRALSEAIKALSKRADGDTISRQAAIDAVCSVCGNDCDKSEFVYNAPQDEQVILCPEHYVLCTLPPAQPKQVTGKLNSDCISRQEAIKELEELNAISFYELNEHSREAYREIKQTLKKLSPAQPERKKGKWVDDGDPLTLICDKCGYRVARYNNTNFCPNCGNDKRGEHGN